MDRFYCCKFFNEDGGDGDHDGGDGGYDHDHGNFDDDDLRIDKPKSMMSNLEMYILHFTFLILQCRLYILNSTL